LLCSKRLLSSLLILLFAVTLPSQSLFTRKSLILSPSETSYKIAESPLIHHSESIKADSLKLIHGLDYLLDYENGLLRLIRMPETEQLQIEYILVPTNLHKPVQLYEIQPASDSLFARIVRKPKVLFNPDGKWR
jgi:hypothetical protein